MQAESPLPEIDLVQAIWQGFISSVDWNSARPDQIDGLAIKELTVSRWSRALGRCWPQKQKFTPLLQPYCTSGKTQVALINAVQIHCYEDTRIIKVFAQLLKVRNAEARVY